MPNTIGNTARAGAPLFTAELVDAQGRNDREYLANHVKLLLEAKERFPASSFADVTQLRLGTADAGAAAARAACHWGPMSSTPAKHDRVHAAALYQGSRMRCTDRSSSTVMRPTFTEGHSREHAIWKPTGHQQTHPLRYRSLQLEM